MEADLDSIEDGLADAHSKWTEFEQLFVRFTCLHWKEETEAHTETDGISSENTGKYV